MPPLRACPCGGPVHLLGYRDVFAGIGVEFVGCEVCRRVAVPVRYKLANPPHLEMVRAIVAKQWRNFLRSAAMKLTL